MGCKNQSALPLRNPSAARGRNRRRIEPQWQIGRRFAKEPIHEQGSCFRKEDAERQSGALYGGETQATTSCPQRSLAGQPECARHEPGAADDKQASARMLVGPRGMVREGGDAQASYGSAHPWSMASDRSGRPK